MNTRKFSNKPVLSLYLTILPSVRPSFCLAPCLMLFLIALQVTVSAKQARKGFSTAGCTGGAHIYCADSGRELRPETPMATPPINQVFRDPDFGSRMIRVTDSSGIRGSLAGYSFTTNPSAEINEWGKFNPALGSRGGYYFYVMTSGGGAIPFAMDAISMRVSPVCDGLRQCRLGSAGSFSYVDPNIIFGHFDKSNALIEAYNLSNGMQSTIYDFNKCPNIPSDLSGYPGAVTNSGDDTKFSEYSGGKMQGFTTLVTFYDRSTDHCYWYDTVTGTTGGTGMARTSVNAGILSPPAAPQLSVTDGNLMPGDYYVELTASTRMNPTAGETTPSSEAHIRLGSKGGIAVSAPALDNPYHLAVAGYNVYIGIAPGQEAQQATLKPLQTGYLQSSDLVKGSPPPKLNTAGYNIHNARLSRDGKVVRISPQQGGAMYFWVPGSTRVSACSTAGPGGKGVADFCGGHTVLGYSNLINHGGPGTNTSLIMRPLSDLTHMRQLIPADPVGVPADMDAHWSWNSADPSDAAPVCGAFSRSSFQLQGDGTQNPATNPLLAIRQAWDREIVCVATSGQPRVWRFAHHRATGACNSNARDGSCFGATAIGNVSQDGKFYLFSSDWEWSLGSATHSSGCPSSGTCRIDVFVVELK